MAARSYRRPLLERVRRNTLRVGDRFPGLAVTTVGGATLTLPDDLRGHRAVILFYRGRW